METSNQNGDRDERIAMEILVDVYDETEEGMSWYVYLENRLSFPFQAVWLKNRAASLTDGIAIDVIGMAPEEDCTTDMLVEVRYQDESGDDEFALPLSAIQPIEADPDTQEAIADWHYWIDMGNMLS